MENKPLMSFARQRKNFLSQMGTVEKKGKMKLILIIVANTGDPVIGKGCALDIKTVQSIFVQLAHFMKFNLVQLIIEGRAYNKKNVLNSLGALIPGNDDIVVFYYTGHGFSFEKEKKIRPPQLDLQSIPATNKIAAIHKATKNLNEIFEIIKTKEARLNIVIGDCCNDEINFTRKFRKKDLKIRLMKEPRVEINYKTCKALFCYPKASILVAAADKGQLSIVDDGIGSIFTLKFTDNLKKLMHTPLVNKKELPWAKLLEKTKTNTFRLSKKFDIGNGAPGNQQAFYEIEKEGFVY